MVADTDEVAETVVPAGGETPSSTVVVDRALSSEENRNDAAGRRGLIRRIDRAVGIERRSVTLLIGEKSRCGRLNGDVHRRRTKLREFVPLRSLDLREPPTVPAR